MHEILCAVRRLLLLLLLSWQSWHDQDQCLYGLALRWNKQNENQKKNNNIQRTNNNFIWSVNAVQYNMKWWLFLTFIKTEKPRSHCIYYFRQSIIVCNILIDRCITIQLKCNSLKNYLSDVCYSKKKMYNMESPRLESLLQSWPVIAILYRCW